jgi:hypothetical protein
MAGKKLGAIPKKYLINRLSPLYDGLILSDISWNKKKFKANIENQ